MDRMRNGGSIRVMSVAGRTAPLWMTKPARNYLKPIFTTIMDR